VSGWVFCSLASGKLVCGVLQLNGGEGVEVLSYLILLRMFDKESIGEGWVPRLEHIIHQVYKRFVPRNSVDISFYSVCIHKDPCLRLWWDKAQSAKAAGDMRTACVSGWPPMPVGRV
jgi:hypothetical protein